MDRIIRYAAVNTKIRALTGQLLTDIDYKALLNKRTIGEIIKYLKQTSYCDILSEVEETHVHRGDLEIMLKRYAVDLLIKLSYYFHGPYRKFFQILLMRFEVEDLKVLIRAIYTDRDYIDTKHPLIYIGRYGLLDFGRLSACKSFHELVDSLKGTEYYHYLVPLASKDQREDEFQIEMALDLSYMSIYKKYIRLLSKREQQQVYNIQGTRTDLLNLQWIYRGIKFYHLPPEVLLNYTVAFGGKLNFNTIRDLCYSKGVEDLEGKMRDSRYKFLFQHDQTKDIFMERRIYRYQYQKLKYYKRMGTMDIVQTIIYFQILEYEIRDIISIVENIRYHNEDMEQVKRCLIRSL